jgi:hypothetical protein
MTPGESWSQAFGHAALVFEEGGLVAYSFGGYVLPGFQSALEIANWFGFEEAVNELTLECLMPLLNGTIRAKKVRQTFEEFECRKAPSQEILLDQLQLTEAQCESLHRQIKDDFAGIEPGEPTVGTYRYDHFRNNCVTRVRDRIIDTLGIDRDTDSSLSRNVHESFDDLIEAALAEGAVSKPLGWQLFAPGPSFEQRALSPNGPFMIPARKGFLSLLDLLFQRVLETSPPLARSEEAAFSRAFHSLGVEIARKPRKHWETIFTPKLLRDALGLWKNPELGRPVLRR